jgi:uncharacterized protein YbjT (DUF2867 family)
LFPCDGLPSPDDPDHRHQRRLRQNPGRRLLRPNSVVPDSLAGCEQHRLDLADAAALDAALRGADALVIATGARPSVDLTGPRRVDAWA